MLLISGVTLSIVILKSLPHRSEILLLVNAGENINCILLGSLSAINNVCNSGSISTKIGSN